MVMWGLQGWKGMEEWFGVGTMRARVVCGESFVRNAR
jgi:hypothetical protein